MNTKTMRALSNYLLFNYSDNDYILLAYTLGTIYKTDARDLMKRKATKDETDALILQRTGFELLGYIYYECSHEYDEILIQIFTKQLDEITN